MMMSTALKDTRQLPYVLIIVEQIVSQNLDEGEIPRFSQHLRLYRSFNFDYLWWIFLVVQPTFCTRQNLHMTFTNILGVLLNTSTSWKICVNEKWPKKSLFFLYWKSWFLTWGQKEGEIYLSPWNHDRWLSPWRTNKVEYICSFWWTNQEIVQ